MKETHYTSPYELEGRLPLGEAVLLGLQHVLAMFASNLTPILQAPAEFPREIRCRLFCFRMP